MNRYASVEHEVNLCYIRSGQALEGDQYKIIHGDKECECREVDSGSRTGGRWSVASFLFLFMSHPAKLSTIHSKEFVHA